MRNQTDTECVLYMTHSHAMANRHNQIEKYVSFMQRERERVTRQFYRDTAYILCKMLEN